MSYSVYVLSEPYRVLIDLPDVTFNLEPGSGEKTLGLIAEFRYGEVAPGRSRIVIDTDGPVLIEKSFIVEAKPGQPARIVVDLVKTSEEAFLKTLEKDQTAAATAISEASETVLTAAPEEQSTLIPLEARAGKRIVVIDPGHGGIDPGAVGRNSIKEKDVVLAVGAKLRDALEKTGLFEVIMTRDSDKFLSLPDRVAVARDGSADLFIALHADTVRGPAASGATIYTLSDTASDAEAEALAEKENRADIIHGIDLGAAVAALPVEDTDAQHVSRELRSTEEEVLIDSLRLGDPADRAEDQPPAVRRLGRDAPLDFRGVERLHAAQRQLEHLGGLTLVVARGLR